MRPTFLLIAMIMAIMFGQPAVSKSKAEVNVVEMTIIRDGKVIGSPRFVMEIGSTAMMMAEVSGGYSVRASLASANEISPRARRLTVDLYIEDKGRWILIGKPVVTTRLGEQGSVSIDLPDRPATVLKFNVTDNWDGKVASSTYGSNTCTEARMVAWEQAMQHPLSVGFTKVALQ